MIPTFDYKEMQQGRGFLVHVTLTYPTLVPFLKGVHLNLDSWRKGRDEEGWKKDKRSDSNDKSLGEADEEDEADWEELEGELRAHLG